MNKDLTAFCGLCCVDCIPSKAAFFNVADRLAEMLSELQFEEYAVIKSGRSPVFGDYPVFLSVLREIRNLRCTSCRQGGGNPGCEVRGCVKKKGLDGCWECGERPGCVILNHLRSVHPNLDYHLDLIAEMGTDKWFEKRKAHYKFHLK